MVDNMTTKSFIFDGQATKAVSIMGDVGWNTYPAEETNGVKLYSTVSWVYRCVDLIRNTAGTIPFDVKRGDTVVDSSSEYENFLGWLENPNAMLETVSAALFIYGQCYFLVKRNRAMVKELQYLVPSSVECLLDEKRGLTGFRRHLGSSHVDYKPEEILYFWLPDATVEIGPPNAWPLKSIEAPASALSNLTAYADAFFERGAVKVTLLTVKGNPPQAEREKLEAWWNRVISGVKNAFGAKVISADSVEATVIGEGLESLKDNTLSEGAVREIATGAGVPYSILMSDAANYATANQDWLNFLNTTIVPLVEFIWEQVNSQLLKPLGLVIVPTPESLDAYQEDESQRAGALTQLVNSGMPLKLGMEILGYDLTPEQWAMLDEQEAEAEEAAEQIQEQMQQQPEQPEEQEPDDRVQEEVKRWRRYALRLGIKRKQDAVKFESRTPIPEHLVETISGAILAAETTEQIRQAFDDADYAGAVEPTSDYTMLFVQMKRLADFLEATK